MTHFSQVTKVSFDADGNEAFVGDGYGNKRVVVVGGGKDTRGNTLKLSSLPMELLASSGDETEISYSMDFNLYGRLATLGNAIVKRKAEEMRVQFTERITAELEGT